MNTPTIAASHPLAGKIALVTGGGRGIGRATALQLAQLGADVAVAARSKDEVDSVAAEISILGRRSVALTADLVDSAAVEPLVSTVESALGRIDILINNAGMVGPFGQSWAIDSIAWETALHINVTAPYLLSRRVLPTMIAAKWGRIVNVSSGIAQNPVPGIGAYAVSKAALDMLTRQIAGELSGTGVTSTSIYPGIVDTAMSASVRQNGASVGEMATNMQRAYDEGKMPKPDYPARLIAGVILTDEAVNGQVIPIGSELGQRLVGLLAEAR